MEIYLTFIALILGFSFSKLTIPAILKVAKAKNIFEPIEERRIHNTKVPSLGGIAVFIGFVLATVITTEGIDTPHLKDVFTALFVLFIIGLKDDLISVRAFKKFLVQLFAAALLVLFGDIRLTSFYGILGINEIGYLTSVSFSILFMVSVINAFNLIDGIDGLASGLAIVASCILGLFFYANGIYEYSIISFAFIGSSFSFFIYNVFSEKNKIFLGDTGSLITGAIMAILLVRYLNTEAIGTGLFLSLVSPSVAFAIISVPIVDTLRVITIRILMRRSPFSPDKNHVHHRLLQLIPSHLKVTAILVGVNLLITFAAVIMTYFSININIQFLLLLPASIILSFVPSWIIRARNSKKSLKLQKA